MPIRSHPEPPASGAPLAALLQRLGGESLAALAGWEHAWEPQLASAPVFHFSATDPAGASWPLVIKAWANGSNPKPVYVLEMIGDVLKLHKLGIGDALALLADELGRFYLEWNTDAARQAAARRSAP